MQRHEAEMRQPRLSSMYAGIYHTVKTSGVCTATCEETLTGHIHELRTCTRPSFKVAQ